jgi:hypothetical protein
MWPDNQNFDLEIQLVVKTIAFAILNSGENVHDIYFNIFNGL